MLEETELRTVVQINDICGTNDNEIVQESKMMNEEHDVSPSKIRNNKQITVLQVIDCNKITVIANDREEGGLENSLNEREDSSIIIKPKKLRIVDSDSEYEGDKDELNIEETHKNEAGECQQSNDSKVYDINNKGELVPEGDFKHKIALTNLCDSESEEEIDNRDISNYTSENVEPIKYKKKPKKKDSELEPKKMTAKEAAEQRKEIESDSQRRVREKHVSLPYHVPKQRTLKEFMKFRKRFASAVPKEAIHKSASVAIKMTEEQLKIVSKNLKEREKEVEEFFKSESEEEDDEEVIETKKDCDKVDGDKAEMELNENSEVKSLEIITVENQDNEESAPVEIPVVMDTEEALKITENNQVETNVILTEDQMAVNTSESKDDNLNNSSGSSNSMELVFNIDDACDDDMDNVECAMNENEICKENEEMVVEKAMNKDLLKQQFANITPCLSGGPNSVIDLDEGITRPDDVSLLMERFARHACKKTPQKHKIQLNITSVSGDGDIHKEKLAVKIDGPDEPEINERPGVRMEKLRNDLQIQMAQKRAEMWKQRVKPPTKDEDMDTYEGERDSCGADDDILDDDEEEELTETEDEDEEEALAKEAKKDVTKSEFFEEEAEESDPVEESEEDESSDEELQTDEGEKKPLKRIIKPFGDDSDEEVAEEIIEKTAAISPPVCNDDDDSPPAAQPNNNLKTPIRPKIPPKADFGFLTPVNRMTCLQNFDSKLAIDSPGSPAIKLLEPSPLKSINWHKKLFIEPESHQTQDSIEELATICSGKFIATQTQQVTEKATHIESTETEPIVEVASTQELMELCSGKFTGATQIVDGATKIESSNEKPSTVETITLGVNKEIKNLGDDNEDKFISQLLDEEEMEQFKRKLNSPEKSQAAKNYFNETEEENEEEDDDTLGKRKKKLKKRKTKAIVDSEDDDDDEEDVGNEEECIDLHDEVDNEDIEVEYDSEENEIEVERTKDEPKKKMKTSDFFENEAELSESEWGSADEDEKDLDQFELELGDKEKFDENKVRSDLEKIHMRRMLDDDNREVKILQEMLLEDGELQGTGRQRQFRWKNIDNQTGDENAEKEANNEDATIDEDEENEEQWRKKRYEREVFLRNSQNSQGSSKESDVTLNSQVLKLGQKAIIRNQNKSMLQVKENDKVKVKQPYSLLNQRGSFLSRGAQVLARVAEYTKVSNPVTGGAKNSRNFVFQTVNNDPDEAVKKRKAPAGETPTAIKKIRLENFSPAVGKKDSKKKLFGNW
ncbi:PREDICTED: claspin isoform X2 [Nicrophorus vespilloides]|uniref:Claspin isoform X2 n=1 Tax=Nicrophorus vespilloides TaxID=110193 RepID=A0ABM1NBQ5_NICVS|nr:PREDICTED: claspin isoform X2 [Nicrophorus vespilloides]